MIQSRIPARCGQPVPDPAAPSQAACRLDASRPGARQPLARGLAAVLMVAGFGLGVTAAQALTPEAPERKPLGQCEPGPKASCANADLRFAVMNGLDLRGADFRGADLSRADLRGANMVGADFTDALLVGANLSRSYLATA